MLYVGVENSRKKTCLVTARKHWLWVEDPVKVAWDCERHLGFLQWCDEVKSDCASLASLGRSDDTAYARYLLGSGRNLEACRASCYRYARMYQGYLQSGKRELHWWPWAVLTPDGLRLDGSHRAAIARHVGLKSIPVAYVLWQWWDWPWRWRMLKRREAILQRKGGQ